MFGPAGSSSVNRPFDDASVNGFDFDFESTVTHMPAFGNKLRELMDGAGDDYLLTAAPQCPYPDAADGEMLAGQVSFDIVWVQFYNNFCGLQNYQPGGGNFNFGDWDNWAKTVSKNPNVKVMIGAPASTTAAGSGYVDTNQLSTIIDYSKQFTSFGGVMMWDASQAYANDGFLQGVRSALSGAGNRTMRRGLRIET